MSKLLKSTVIVLAILLATGVAWSMDITNHVKVAPNGKGDVLIFPFYFTDGGGYETKLTVINTSLTDSVVAKVVIRGWRTSPELMDFLLFLSPTDMWTGVIRTHASRGTIIYSTDGSCQNDTGAFATAAAPMNWPLYQKCGDPTNYGYAYVITTWRANLGAPPVAKTTIRNNFLADLQPAGTPPPPPVLTRTPSNLYNTGNGRSNVLSGYLDFRNATVTFNSSNLVTAEVVNDNSTLEALTLRDYFTNVLLYTAQETFLGTNADNNAFEIEATINKGLVAIPYVKSTDLYSLSYFCFLFPVKYFDCTNARTARSGPFWAGRTAVVYGAVAFDMEENWQQGPQNPYSGAPGTPPASLPNELTILNSAQFPFAEGWVMYNMAVAPTLSNNAAGQAMAYDGVPVVVTSVKMTNLALSAFYPSYTDTAVWADLTPTPLDGVYGRIFDYQYADERNERILGAWF